MIRVRIKKAVFIRKGPSRSFAAIGTVFPSGKEIVMDGLEEGENWKGINKWYYRFNAKKEKQYYWAGGAEVIDENKAVSLNGILVKDKIDNPLITTLGIDHIWRAGEYGELAKVAILDSGIALNCTDLTDSVNDFAANSASRMKNFVKNSTTMDDDYGHGSHCAGLIASRNRQHIVGMAPGCHLYVGKIRDVKTNVNVPNMISGIRWAAGLEAGSPQDIDIISMSNGSLLNMPDMQPTINEALSKNKILIFSIGNRGPGGVPTGGNFPARFPGVISVGAVDLQHNFLPFNYQFNDLTICCPGQDIFSYGVQGELKQQSGTSQATAICAGIVALLVSKLKRQNVPGIPKKIMELLLSSESRTTSSGYPYRFINPVKLFRTIN